MRRATFAARIALGLVFVVFGVDGLSHFLPAPPMPDAARAVIDVLVSYRLFYVLKGLEIVSGLLLLWGRFVPLALTLLGPILFNIVWFDLNLDPASLPVAGVLVCLETFLLWTQKGRFAPLLDAR
jgi:putative oxidoreductase